MAIPTVNVRWTAIPGAVLLAALFAGCGPGPKRSQFFDRVRLEPMLARCEKHFEAIEDKGSGGEVKGPEKSTNVLWFVGSLSPDEIDPLLEDCKSYLLRTARENGATMSEEELPEPLRKQACKGFVFSYTVGKERRGTIQVTAISTDLRKLSLKCSMEEDEFR